MPKARPELILVAVLALVSGCNLYWDDDGDDVCAGRYEEGGSGACCGTFGSLGDKPDRGIALQLRNPETGECSDFGYGGCDYADPCFPCVDTGALPPNPDWAACYSNCDSLDEASCLTATGCYAAYYDGRLQPGSGSGFRGCWAVAPSGPVHGSCTNLDAHECSRHDDCSAIYTVGDTTGATTLFERCAPEPTSVGCSDVDCGPGSHCEQQCYCDPSSPNEGGCAALCRSMCVPNDTTCAHVDCGPGSTCVEVCTSMGGGDPANDVGLSPPGQCYPSCVPIDNGDPGSCYGEITCYTLIPVEPCPAGTTHGIKDGCYTGYCIPLDDCGPGDPGTCDGAVCAIPPPLCPSNTVPGVTNGCWSGYCIPTGACPQPACEALTTESACTARGDCLPVYLGDDCTCYPGYCECNILTYERCQSALMPF